MIPGSLALLLGLGGAGCAMTPLQAAVQATAAGQPERATGLYQQCIADPKTRDLDCYIGLGELWRPDGPQASCAKFRGVAKEARAAYGGSELFIGAHARQHVSPAALHYPNLDSIEEWFAAVERDCRQRDEDEGELREGRRQDVMAHGCVKRRLEPTEKIAPAEADKVAALCDDLRKNHLDDTGIDRDTDKAIAEAMVFAAVVTLDDSFARVCDAEALRPVCPGGDAIAKRQQARVRALAEAGPAEESLKWTRTYLKRWPKGPDADPMRLARERASLDIALEQPPGSRLQGLEEFLSAWPQSPLRHEALEKLWEEAQAHDRAEVYRSLAEHYPTASWAAEAKRRGRK